MADDIDKLANMGIHLADHKAVSPSAWIEASQQLLIKEKEFTMKRDELSRQRRDLPWMKVEEDYNFHGSDGSVKLSELFDGKSQLIIYHAMWGPNASAPCEGCSFVMDHLDAARNHFEQNDIAFAAVSRGPYSHFEGFKKRMGWTFRWLSSEGSTFNFDYNVSFHREDLDKREVFYNFRMQKLSGEEQPGLTSFYKNENGEMFRTYSTYERGLDLLVGAYNFIDLTAKGRSNDPELWAGLRKRFGSQT